MSSSFLQADPVGQALKETGLDAAFDETGQAWVMCPRCGAERGLKLSLPTQRVQCRACHISAPLQTFLAEAAEYRAYLSDAPVFTETRLASPAGFELALPHHGPMSDLQANTGAGAILPGSSGPAARKRSASHTSIEKMIMTALSVIFMSAGLIAACLSGYANYQAFSQMVSDPIQAGVWGWSGVIASVCAFGGFTFFWWHMSDRRMAEAMRAFLFALAGSATSLAGTHLYMQQNHEVQVRQQARTAEIALLDQAELNNVLEQLALIPAETRSVSGLQAYLKGVEQVGRTHHKAYRDAQNELGMARRRAALEKRSEQLRQNLRAAAGTPEAQPQRQGPPAWLFALMLEVFSSQATSIGCVCLILIFTPRRRFALSESGQQRQSLGPD